jgi:hypothetical protein
MCESTPEIDIRDEHGGIMKLPIIAYCSYCGQRLVMEWNSDRQPLNIKEIKLDVDPCSVCLETLKLKTEAKKDV